MDRQRDRNVRLALALGAFALAVFVLSMPLWVRILEVLGSQL